MKPMSNILDALVTASERSDLPLTLAGSGVSAGPIHDTFGVSRASNVVVNDGVGTLVFGPNIPEDLHVTVPLEWETLAPVLSFYDGSPKPTDQYIRLCLGLVLDIPSWQTDLVDDHPLCFVSALKEPDASKELCEHRMGLTSAFSCSHLEIEVYGALAYVDIHYRSASPPGLVSRWNELHGTRFPTDLPLDVVGLLAERPVADAPLLRERLDEANSSQEKCLALLALGFFGEAFSVEDLTHWTRDALPEVRRAAIMIAGHQGHLELLKHCATTETEPKVLESIDHFLHPAPSASNKPT
jgi:hypothetical protein